MMIKGRIMKSGKPLQWNRELVSDFWDTVSQSKLAQLSFSALAGNACFQVFEPFLDKSKPYLDFGGGDGDFARLLVSKGFRVASFDVSETRVAETNSRLASLGENFLGCVGAETKMKFAGVFLIEVAEHILEADIVETYERIQSLLDNDGLLFVTTPNNEDLDLNAAYDPQSGVFFHRWQHVRSFDRSKLTAMLKRFGFEEILTHEIEFKQDVFDAMNAALAHSGLPNPFATMRPVYMGAQSNLVGVFSYGKTPIVIDPTPYFISVRTMVELPSDAAYRVSPNAPTVFLSSEGIVHDAGFCYRIKLDVPVASDNGESHSASLIRLFENGVPLGPSHALHADIRASGGGAYSHWRDDLYFSSSDGSDPRANGRRYEIRIATSDSTASDSAIFPNR
jgi:2-polyprenyl-3-methyl-5-hydroxy-6-metoxy-1,4-benzoquinol methylase